MVPLIISSVVILRLGVWFSVNLLMEDFAFFIREFELVRLHVFALEIPVELIIVHGYTENEIAFTHFFKQMRLYFLVGLLAGGTQEPIAQVTDVSASNDARSIALFELFVQRGDFVLEPLYAVLALPSGFLLHVVTLKEVRLNVV